MAEAPLPSARIDELLAAAEKATPVAYKHPRLSWVREDRDDMRLHCARGEEPVPIYDIADPATITALIAEVKAARAANGKPFDLDRFLQDDSNLPPFALPPVKEPAEIEHDIAMAELLEEAASALAAKDAELARRDMQLEASAKVALDLSAQLAPPSSNRRRHKMALDAKGLEAAIAAHETRQDPTKYATTVQDYGLQESARKRVQMSAAITAYLSALSPAASEMEPVAWRWTTWPHADIDGDEWPWTLTDQKSTIPSYATVEPLYALPPKTEGWRPIETAPKDGTTILMGKFHDGDFYWMASGRIEDGQFWCDFPDEFFVPFSHQNPTHWMPLPAPPKAGE